VNYSQTLLKLADDLAAHPHDGGLDISRNLVALAESIGRLQDRHKKLLADARRFSTLMSTDVAEEVHKLSSHIDPPIHPSER
jgi:uncharacterized protein YPO0396